ncbi:O-antigen ligase family protein [Mycolicibacterium vaccae]|uniref:O-antigen ligase family protein n=1 Tax=Mycolicibacterium vaccae TaxID=1810 RepID=UPI003CE67714
MNVLHIEPSSAATTQRAPALLPAVVIASIGVSAVGGAMVMSADPGQLLLLATVGAGLGGWALRSPSFAVMLMAVALFLRTPLSQGSSLPIELWLLVFVLLVIATGLWLMRTSERVRGAGPVEWAMALFLLWNVYSMVSPHEYGAIDPDTGGPLPVVRFIVVATLIPFTLYLVGRYTFDTPKAVRALLWTILVLATYSAAVSIMPAVGLGGRVWPRYIVDDPAWEGRAVGIFNQPVVNGMVLTLGFAIAMFFCSHRDEPRWRRIAAAGIAVSCGIGIYLTYTRAVWLSALLVLIVGALLAKGFRAGFVVALGLVTTAVLLNWSTFTSSDREAGGVASESEVQSRLNDIQTALWARTEKPLAGWGIGRFPAVNTYHHQQWSQDVPWAGGYGEAAHSNEMGVLAELGGIGLALWLSVLIFIVVRLRIAYRRLTDNGMCGRPLAVIAIMAMTILVCTGLTVDLRYFDFPTATTFLVIGIAAGWAERVARPAQTPAPVPDVEREPVHHA